MSPTHLTDTIRLAGTRWRLEPAGSSAEFRVPSPWSLGSVKGHFEHLEGWLEIDDREQWHMVLMIDADSVDTGNARRNKHLRSPAFFNVDKHPVVRFRSVGVIDQGDGRLAVDGRLEAAGQQVPLELDVSVTQADGRLELSTEATVDQRDLGMRFSPLRVIGTPTALRVQARLHLER